MPDLPTQYLNETLRKGIFARKWTCALVSIYSYKYFAAHPAPDPGLLSPFLQVSEASYISFIPHPEA
jgi:hypothetical protein